MGLNYSQMANSGSRTYCNTFWAIFFELSQIDQKSTKCGPAYPLFITKVPNKIQDNLQTSSNNIIFSYLNILEIHNFPNFEKYRTS